MAIRLMSEKSNLKVILRSDDALSCSAEAFDAYVEAGLNEERLSFHEGKEPTRFVMRAVLDFETQQAIMNNQIQFKPGKKGLEQEIKVGFMFDEVRASLIDIENPKDLPKDQWIEFKRDSDGQASKSLISSLHGAGLVTELYGSRQAYLQGKQHDNELLKKS